MTDLHKPVKGRKRKVRFFSPFPNILYAGSERANPDKQKDKVFRNPICKQNQHGQQRNKQIEDGNKSAHQIDPLLYFYLEICSQKVSPHLRGNGDTLTFSNK